jgi:hypothetical protein
MEADRADRSVAERLVEIKPPSNNGRGYAASVSERTHTAVFFRRESRGQDVHIFIAAGTAKSNLTETLNSTYCYATLWSDTNRPIPLPV